MATVAHRSRRAHKQHEESITHKGFYSRADAARLARVPIHRIDAWRREKIVYPTLVMLGEDGKQRPVTPSTN